MKRNLLTIVVLFSTCLLSFSQTPGNIIGRYYWKNSTIIYACDKDGKDLILTANESNTNFSTENQTFDVLYEITVSAAAAALPEKYAIIKIGLYDKAKQPSRFYQYNFKGTQTDLLSWDSVNKDSKNHGQYERFFKIKTADLLINATKYTYIGGALTGGILNFPFKLRLQKSASDFSSAFNLGAAMGYTFPHYDYRSFTFSALLAVSITTINLDASSVSRNAEKLETTNNFSALSSALGIMASYDKFQAGIFLGFDRLGKLNNDTFNWAYQNKPWLSLGFGYSIFSVQKEKANEGTSDNLKK